MAITEPAPLLPFHWPETLRERVEAFRRSKVALNAGYELINSGIYRFRSFPPVAVDLFTDWTVDPVGNRSWQWHSASFNFIPWLIALHADSGDSRAIAHAVEAIASWSREFVEQERDYEFAWHDHATANRVMNVLSLLCHLVEYPAETGLDMTLLLRFLDTHGERLTRPEMYTRHTNHGIDQSRVLALLASCAPWLEHAPQWRQIAMDRLEDELGHAFAHDGGHIENSPGYHQFVSNIFTDVMRTFADLPGFTFKQKLEQMLPRAARFMTWCLRPDGRFPPLGDTECKPGINVYHTLAGTPVYGNVQWMCSRGQEGIRPEGKSAIFPDSGYFFARNDWQQEIPRNDSYHLIMRCGRRSGFHRHDDDLTLLLWWGTDWLLDGGAHNYMEGEPTRRYLRSKWAHNVVVVNEDAPDWGRPGAAASGTIALQSDDGARATVLATTESYPGLTASRELQFDHSTRRFEVRDRVQARGGDAPRRRFLSLWHIPADKTIHVDGQSVRIVDQGLLRQLVIHNRGRDFDAIRVLDALPGDFVPVWSRELNKLERCRVVAFEHEGTDFESALEFVMEDMRPDHRDAVTAFSRPRGLFHSYCRKPEQWWPAQSLHHARKISGRLQPVVEDPDLLESAIEELLALAILRQKSRKPTLHLSNMGNPGPATLEAWLRSTMGMLPAGEVYLPGAVQRILKDWPSRERILFIDAVHLLHARAKPGGCMFNSIVNASQGQYQEVFWRDDPAAVRIVAKRDPMDAVLLAMVQHRPPDGWATEADVEAELSRQIHRVERFTSWMKRQRFTLEFQIEGIAAAPGPVLEKIADLCNASIDRGALASLTGADKLSSSPQDEEIISLHGLPLRQMLRPRLAELRQQLGYA